MPRPPTTGARTITIEPERLACDVERDRPGPASFLSPLTRDGLMRSLSFRFDDLRRVAACCARLGVGFVFAASLAQPVFATPFRPADSATVIYVVPGWLVASRAKARNTETTFTGDPGDLPTALQTARRAIRDGRANADPRLYGRAQAALAPWWSSTAPPPEVRVLRAVILQAGHDFAGALQDLDAVVAANPTDGQARLTRAFVLQATGALDRAAADCRALPRSVGLTTAVACASRVAALTGDADRALDRLTRVIALDRGADPGMRRFATSIAAEIAAMLGRDSQAEQYLVAAPEGSTDLPSRVAYADFLLDTDRPAEVLVLLAEYERVDVALLRLAIAGKRVGDPRAADWTTILAERFSVARAGHGPIHLREEARFELEVQGDPKRALRLASENWTIEKEVADARLVLEAALAAHQPEAAADVVAFTAATGLVDRRVEKLRQRLAAETGTFGPRLVDPRPLAR
jgi:tetratricopeptide (TPR) repeat protein